MKKLLNVVCISLCYFSTHAQIANATISEDFKQLSSGSNNAGFQSLQTYSTDKTKGSQFFYADWAQGSIITIDSKNIESKDYVFLFDKVRQLLFFKNNLNANDNSNNNVLMADPDKLKAFTLVTDKPHYFVKASDYDASLKNNFFEMLVKSDNYTLLKLTTTTFVKADHHDVVSIQNGDLSDAFVDHTTYYIYHDNTLQKTNLQQYSIRKTLKDQKAKLDDYFNLHQNDEMNEALLVNLINYLNT